MNILGKLTVFFSGCLLSSVLCAVEIQTEYTAPVEGTPPELTIGAKGCLVVGEQLIIDPSDPNTYLLTDLDGDDKNIAPIFGGDESLSTLQWYLFENDERDFDKASQLGDFPVLTIPEEAVGKFIGFKITPKTKIGLPNSNITLQVSDLRTITSVKSNGLITKKNNNFITCSNDGRVQASSDLPRYAYIYEVDRYTGLISDTPIPLTDFHPKTRRTYEVKVYADKAMKQDITTNYSGKVQWFLHEENEAPAAQNLVKSVSNNEFRFQVQPTNVVAQKRSIEEESEQGLMLTVKIDP